MSGGLRVKRAKRCKSCGKAHAESESSIHNLDFAARTIYVYPSINFRADDR